MKKELERAYLDSFLAAVGWTVDEVLIDEEPDFILIRGRERIGLEITRLFGDEKPWGSPMKRTEVGRLRFLKQLSEEYYRRGGVPLLVKLDAFANYEAIELTTPEIPALVDRLLPAAAVLAPWAEEIILAGNDSTKLWLTRLPDELVGYSRWIPIKNSLGWRRTLTDNYLEARIADKAKLLPTYRNKADRVVLLLIADETKASGFLQYRGSGVASEGFEAVYFHAAPNGQVSRIALAKD